MARPKQYGLAVNMAYAAGFVFYVLIGTAGYLMFGEAAADIVSLSLGKASRIRCIINVGSTHSCFYFCKTGA
jgi:hypothetical protein